MKSFYVLYMLSKVFPQLAPLVVLIVIGFAIFWIVKAVNSSQKTGGDTTASPISTKSIDVPRTTESSHQSTTTSNRSVPNSIREPTQTFVKSPQVKHSGTNEAETPPNIPNPQRRRSAWSGIANASQASGSSPQWSKSAMNQARPK